MRLLVIIALSAALPLRAQESIACQGLERSGFHLEIAPPYIQPLNVSLAALEDAKRQLGPDHIAVGQILMCVGAIHILRHEYSAARMAMERSLAITEKIFATDDIQTGYTLMAVALLALKQEYYVASESLYGRARTILEAKLGPEHEQMGLLHASLGKLYLIQRRCSEAEAALEKAVPILEKAGERDQAILVVVLCDLAEAYQRDHRLEKAEPLYSRVLAMVESNPGDINDDIRMGLRAYARMLRQMKRKSDARTLEVELKTLLPR